MQDLGVYDLVVIGGGPAGSLLTSLVRRQDPDRSVLVLEREEFPRHHVGESTIPSWRPILQRAGLLEKLDAAVETRKVGTIFLWGREADESWTIDFRDVETRCAPRGAYQVDRAVFDDLLLTHAAEQGAHVRQRATVRRVGQREAGVFTLHWDEGDGEGYSARARYLADASGQARIVSRQWGIPSYIRDDMNNYAVYGYWEGSQLARYRYPVKEHERWTYIATTDDGWVWHIPISDVLTSVGVVTQKDLIPPRSSLEEFYRRNVGACEPIAELLRSAKLVQHPRAPRSLMVVTDWSWGCSKVCGEGWFLLGDAAAFVDPILSSGLLIASSAASLVANAFHTLWNDPDVDVPLLLESYQSTYKEMVDAYHRLARVWYGRNFHKSTWHWEAKRQRLRAGGATIFETDERAFLSLGLGSFANPLDAAVDGLRPRLDRPDIRIYQQHLFADDAGPAAIDAAGLERAMHAGEEQSARTVVKADVMERWRHLLGCRLRMAGCRWRLREGYHTDGFSDGWRRLRYLQVEPLSGDEDSDRIVFPSIDCAPYGLLPHLDGSRVLREIIDELLGDVRVGSEVYEALKMLLFHQVVHLDLRGWIELVGEPIAAGAARADAAFTLPEAVAGPLRVAAAGATLTCSVDVVGTKCTFRFDGNEKLSALELVSAEGIDPRSIYKKTATAAISYLARTLTEATREMVNELVGSIEAWERRDPASARGWWGNLRAVAGGEFRV